METEKENEIQALTREEPHVDCLAELTDCQAKAKILEASLPQVSSEVEVNMEKENEKVLLQGRKETKLQQEKTPQLWD
ncbi:unnamed protein product [Pleuronectes platessa]|uniref:Uncharacterized protein n=1 Tax=Pleuronectes platessa TaxID=8262 RepID=A0A9N7URA2_PLEPL|nr:unnamed protein product [Pleuronectes platessa]